MALGHPFAPMRERHMERDHEMAVARPVERATRPVAPLDEARQGHRGQLALGMRLVEAGPHGRPLRRVLADGKRVQELEPDGLGEEPDGTRGALIGVIVRALEERRVAMEEIAVPVDHAVTAR